MTTQEFCTAFNTRGAEIGHEVRIIKTEEDKNASVLVCDEHVSIIAGTQDDVMAVQIICTLREDAVTNGLTAFCTAIDVLCQGDVTWRNGLLRRLHLFDGKLGKDKSVTQARGWELSVCPQNPARNLMSYFLKRLA